MEKLFLIIQNNQVENVTVGTSKEEVINHFPTYEIEEFIDRETVIEKYGHSKFFPFHPEIIIDSE